MKITLPSGEYSLWIHHEGLSDKHPLPKEHRWANGHPVKARTVARLEEADGRLIAEQHALCSALDTFRKKDGVRIAVTRLIHAFAVNRRSMISREERSIIWARVWNLKPHGHQNPNGN